MSLLEQITVLILTYNEAENIGRTLDALASFPSLVVLDSGSTDGTQDIVAGYRNARLAIRRFDSHASQWNYGLTSCGVFSPWILALDADYVLPASLVHEIAQLTPGNLQSGYRIGFRYCVFGRPLSATLYPPIVALYRRERAYYVQEGHTQRLIVDGTIGRLVNRINHDDRKPLSRWFVSQQKYANLEADHILGIPPSKMRRIDRIRLMAWPAPVLIFLYTLFAKRCILDGWAGWLYVLQRTLAETMLAIEIVDRRLRASQR